MGLLICGTRLSGGVMVSVVPGSVTALTSAQCAGSVSQSDGGGGQSSWSGQGTFFAGAECGTYRAHWGSDVWINSSGMTASGDSNVPEFSQSYGWYSASANLDEQSVVTGTGMGDGYLQFYATLTGSGSMKNLDDSNCAGTGGYMACLVYFPFQDSVPFDFQMSVSMTGFTGQPLPSSASWVIGPMSVLAAIPQNCTVSNYYSSGCTGLQPAGAIYDPSALTAATPEPGTWALLIGALLVVVLIHSRARYRKYECDSQPSPFA